MTKQLNSLPQKTDQPGGPPPLGELDPSRMAGIKPYTDDIIPERSGELGPEHSGIPGDSRDEASTHQMR